MSISGMLTNTVDITLRGEPVNVGGTNVPTETVVAGVACSVQESNAAPRTDQDIEGSISSGKIFFDHDPGVKEGDTMTWMDGGGRTLIASGKATNAAGKFRLFRIRWTEID